MHDSRKFQIKVNTMAAAVGITDTQIRFDAQIVEDLQKIHSRDKRLSSNDFDKQLMSLLTTVKHALINNNQEPMFHFVDADALDFNKVLLSLHHQQGLCQICKQTLH